jgi:hypothetical protein
MAMTTRSKGTPVEVASSVPAPNTVEQHSNDHPPTPDELMDILESIPPPAGSGEFVPDEPGEPGWPAMPVPSFHGEAKS